MQHDIFLKKLNFDLLVLGSVEGGSAEKNVLKKWNFDILTPPLKTKNCDLKSCLICFINIVPLSACVISAKMTTD